MSHDIFNNLFGSVTSIKTIEPKSDESGALIN